MRLEAIHCWPIITVALGASYAQSAPEDMFHPEVRPIERYEHIWKKSPFFIESTVVVQSEGLEKRFALTGIATVENKPIAFVFDRQSLSRQVIKSGEANPQGVELISVQADADLKKSTVVIRLGPEQATLSYDSAMLSNIEQGPQGEASPTPLSSTLSGGKGPQNTKGNSPAPTPTPGQTPPKPGKTFNRPLIKLHG